MIQKQYNYTGLTLITFRVSRRRHEMYIGRVCLSVCLCVRLCVCLSLAALQHYCMDPHETWGRIGGPF